MAIQRVALIFDNTARPETTGLYCRRALGQLVDVEHFLPEELPDIPRDSFDLFLQVDDGLHYEWPPHLGPSALWAIDTHLDLQWAIRRSQSFDYIFAAQRDGAEQLRAAGIESARWLPLACDPLIHRSYEVPEQYDVGFVGNVFPGPRADLLQAIQREFPNTFIGRRYFEQMAQAYSACRSVFNCSIGNDINMRVFEVLACGVLLVTNDLAENGLADLFIAGKELVTYTDEQTLLAALGYYLQHPDERQRIAETGRAAVLARHTYLHRMSTLLRTVERGEAARSLSTIVQTDRHGQSCQPAVSACLLAWQRPANVRQIVEQLLAEPLIDDITVWNNNPFVPLTFDLPRVRVFDSPTNRMVLGRYECVLQARHETVYVQDDDCLVHNFSQLYDSFRLAPDQLTCGLKLWHLCSSPRMTFGDAQLGLVGWGAFLNRNWISVLDRYRDCYGEDELLLREADRIFTVLLGRRHRFLPAEVTDLPGCEGAEALSVDPRHGDLTRAAIERAIGLLNGHSKTVTGRQQTTLSAAKDPTYFEFDRPDVLELVPGTAQHVLDIGCGGGRLGAALKARQSCEVVGIELNPAAAASARSRLDEVVIGNVETDDIAFPEGRFDCVICADVLEHLRDPSIVLRRIREWLTPDGCLVTSIPNVRHHTVVQSLLAGNWTYETAGLLDADHVRFFTRREIEKLLFRCGFDVDELRMMPGEGFGEWVERGRPQQISVGGLQIAAVSEADAQEFFAYQYLVRATPDRVTDPDNAAFRPPTVPQLPSGVNGFSEQFPWPAECPAVKLPLNHGGWFADGAREVLRTAVTPGMQLIVELGSWLGLSTRFLSDRAPHAKIIAIDHWQGSSEHRRNPEFETLLPSLYEGFLSSCWDYRDRIVPARLSTQAGLQAVADAGLQPDLIFVDADHTYAAVRDDLKACRRHFPTAVLTGDDFDDPDVQRAVHEIAAAEKLELSVFGQDWRAWKLEAPIPSIHRSPARRWGLTSIIIVTHNQLPYTQACLDSIRLRTDEPYELILVDNGSTDGTVDYLRSLPDVRLICNDSNRGFPAAVNQGITVACGDQVLLLNNDTLVTTGWLRRMLDVLHSAPTVGLVGPVSNNVGSDQQIPVGYSQVADLDGWAWDYQRSVIAGSRPDQPVRDTCRLIGFCLLMSRALIKTVGLLDERFGVGCFEDDDLCRRAIEAGFDVLIARAAFIHHFGSTTFRASGIDLHEVLQRNKRLYDEKWQGGSSQSSAQGKELLAQPSSPSTVDSQCSSLAYPRPQYVIEQATDEGLLLVPNTLRLSVCLIVRDNEGTIRPCLESIRPWVDEIVVVDTGSIDRTPEICRELGARVFCWPWQDNFAAARNVSLDRARGEWILWMDSDDTIPEACGRQLRALADKEHLAHILGYVVQVQCPGSDPHDVTIVDHVKLIRNRPDLRFEFRIHEQILPSIRRAGGDVEFTDIYVVHSGSDHSDEGRQRKLVRDFRLLELELAERPHHPFVLFNLGMTHADAGQLAEAADYLERCIAVSQSHESHLRKAFALLVSALQRDGQTDAAVVRCEQGLQLYPTDKELLFRRGMLQHEVGELEEAADTYRRVLHEPTDRQFSSVDCDLAGCKSRHNLALVLENMGECGAAEAEWRHIIVEQPTYRAAWHGLGECLLRQGRDVDLEQLSDSLAHRSELRCERLWLDGHLAARRGELSAALNLWSQAGELDPVETSALRATCQLLFENGFWAAAVESLCELAARAPTDASTWRNLSRAYEQLGEADAAASARERADEFTSPRSKGVVARSPSSGERSRVLGGQLFPAV